MKAAVVHGIGLGVFFFCIYSCETLRTFKALFAHFLSISAYALAFYFGTTLILSGDSAYRYYRVPHIHLHLLNSQRRHCCQCLFLYSYRSLFARPNGS